MKININIKKAYTILIVCFPILSIYRSPISAVDLGTFLMCTLGAIVLFLKRGEIQYKKIILSLIIYVMTITIISIFSAPLYASTFSILVRMFRLVILLGIFMFCDKEYFDLNYGMKLLQKITIIASIYLILQFLIYTVSGYILPSFIPGLTKLEGIAYRSTLSAYARFYRPTSFFLEPSSFVYFASLMLVCSLFLENYFVLEYKEITAVLITIAILLSTSGQGFIVISVTWGVWCVSFLFHGNLNRKRMIKIFGVLIGIITIIPVIMRSEIVNRTLGRIFVEDPNSMSAIDARSGGYEMFNSLSIFRKIVGMGFGNLPDNVYFSSIADILFTLGIIGLFIVLVLYFDLFLHGKLFQKMLCVVSIVLMVGGGLFTATYLLFYLPFITCRRFSKEKYRI